MRALSPKVLRDIRDLLRALMDGEPWEYPLQRMHAHVELALAPKRATLAARPARAKKKASKREETAAIRAAVFARAGDVCELCHERPALELHHAMGRVRVRQAVSNCLALCRWCHLWLTRNEPSATYWLRAQIQHFNANGYESEARRMEARLASLQLQGRAGAA